MNRQDWVGISEASKLSGKSVSTMRRWCDGRLIKSRKIKGERKIDRLSLLTYLATECSMPVSPKNHDTHQDSKKASRETHMALDERLSSRDERIAELKLEISELKEQNKILQSEIIKNGYELRAILAEQTGSSPSSWIKSRSPHID